MAQISDLKLPPLLPQTAIIDVRTGAATQFFQDVWNKLTSQLVGAINNLNAAVSTLQVAQQANVASQEAVVTVAQSNAAAQATADAGGPAQSGDSLVTLDLPRNTGFNAGPQVNLAAVVAGSLGIASSGPSQASGTVALGPSGSYNGAWRIQEIAGGPEVTVFTGTWTVEISRDDIGNVVLVFNTSISETTAPIARATAGAVSYRLDVQALTGVDVNNLQVYLYVRRA